MKRFLNILTLSYLILSITIVCGQEISADLIQKEIDLASDGQEILLPEGKIIGSITIEKPIILKGMGIDRTVFENDQDTVTINVVNNDSKISDLTVVGGYVGIELKKNFSVIQNVKVLRASHIGIHVLGGAPLILNNTILENGKLAGIAVNSGFPMIINNVIMNNKRNGIWSWYPFGMEVVNNIIIDNRFAIAFGAGSKPIFNSNIIFNNQLDFDTKDIYENENVINKAPIFFDIESENFSLIKDSPGFLAGKFVDFIHSENSINIGLIDNDLINLDFQAYKENMSRFLPQLTYELTDVEGEFIVMIDFHRAPFTVASSSLNTFIDYFKAQDTLKENPLVVEINEEKKVLKAVEKDTKVTAGNYRLIAKFYDLESYKFIENKVFFNRKTSFSKVKVIYPKGFKVIQPNKNLVIDEFSQEIKIQNPNGKVEITLEK